MGKFLWILLPLAVAGCAAPPRGPAPAAPPAHATAPAADGEAWRVTDSRLAVRVYRDGPMQQLGHNHLITSHALAGEIRLGEPLTASRFALRLPLDSLVVDDTGERARAGGDFAAPLPDRDRDATRRNLLGERVLDAARQSEILLTAESISGGPADFEAQVRVSLAGAEHVLAVPFTLTVADGRLVARADLQLTHADLGLDPYTVALGALRVRDDFEVELIVEARRGS
ncbi:MAG: YceI family protein [Gammaproteobacteria bacterium]|nr:YceI family protein [Gammaproteobacteria bacterium]